VITLRMFMVRQFLKPPKQAFELYTQMIVQSMKQWD